MYAPRSYTLDLSGIPLISWFHLYYFTSLTFVSLCHEFMMLIEFSSEPLGPWMGLSNQQRVVKYGRNGFLGVSTQINPETFPEPAPPQ